VAIWQVPIEFVPTLWAEENDFKVAQLYDEDGFDTSCAWEKHQPTKDLERLFGHILPAAKSWDEDLLLWGNDKTHDIHVWREEGLIFSIGFRLDLREKITSIASSLIEVANELDCVFFVPDQEKLFEPNMFAFIQYVRNSNAAKFVKDPAGYLDEVSSEINKT
jgi:hypothetical protein